MGFLIVTQDMPFHTWVTLGFARVASLSEEGMSAFMLLRIEPGTHTWYPSPLPLSYTPATDILILKQSGNNQEHRTSVYKVCLDAPAKGEEVLLNWALHVSYSLIKVFPSGNVSNLVSVARSHAKK